MNFKNENRSSHTTVKLHILHIPCATCVCFLHKYVFYRLYYRIRPTATDARTLLEHTHFRCNTFYQWKHCRLECVVLSVLSPGERANKIWSYFPIEYFWLELLLFTMTEQTTLACATGPISGKTFYFILCLQLYCSCVTDNSFS